MRHPLVHKLSPMSCQKKRFRISMHEWFRDWPQTNGLQHEFRPLHSLRQPILDSKKRTKRNFKAIIHHSVEMIRPWCGESQRNILEACWKLSFKCRDETVWKKRELSLPYSYHYTKSWLRMNNRCVVVFAYESWLSAHAHSSNRLGFCTIANNGKLRSFW
jgi:hypothetical protein